MKLALSLFFLLSINIFSQNKETFTSEKYKELQEKVRLQLANNIDSAFYYCDQIEISNNPLHVVFSKSYKSYLHQLKGDTVTSNVFMNEANQILKKEIKTLDKIKIDTHVYNLEGLIAKKRGKLNIALEKFEKGKSISKEINELTQLYKFNNNIGMPRNP